MVSRTSLLTRSSWPEWEEHVEEMVKVGRGSGGGGVGGGGKGKWMGLCW